MDMKLQEKILRDRWHELTTRLRKIDTDLGRTKAIDDEDRAIENENDEVLEGLGQAGEEELRAIDAALERIAKGTYGTCARCGAGISAARLAVLPQTPLCEDCAAGK
ncbi:TraR/DksA family transcriptional regulator [Sinorhizobium sp. B11]|jgi:RNA polymerase-binding transcription factor DksA|uniref:TraR/DksA family transcriptional regulator n=1 Tax=unclassified Rhizobium TaxID=2613769 RepID=UPI000DD9EFBA|nr:MULTISPECIES: TraR/DksA family transcriptional regulator [unclassified Rhizobium]MBB3443393.1 RNA polymerase-binding transcription factor DksA [Rhizobium sp. BK379]MBB3563365.1 RNA polymerase-binding transcription factor DksA [Rhizobium sp. BK512]